MTQTTVETVDPASLAWFRIAVVYFAAGVILGVFMGASGDITLFSVHSHLNLLGWEALALIGLVYHCLPAAGHNRLASTHFWLHNLGLPVMMAALVAKDLGNTRMEPVLGVSSTVVGVAILLFAINVLIHARPGRTP